MDALEKLTLFGRGYSISEIEELNKKTKGKKKKDIDKGILESLR